LDAVHRLRSLLSFTLPAQFSRVNRIALPWQINLQKKKRTNAGEPAGDPGMIPGSIRMNVKIIRMPTVKKTWLIDPVLVQRARKICGARTETETVTRALQEILVRDEIDKAFRRYGPALADIEDMFHTPARR
jgi:hypothetical protein